MPKYTDFDLDLQKVYNDIPWTPGDLRSVSVCPMCGGGGGTGDKDPRTNSIPVNACMD